ncbi:MAG TPA: helix-hairpin-helix domain-containing protein [Acidimicrobiales bacterium]|nr:helix-hairpin-helix domain-containing protein [Acidimicrobiales bacterium]
MTGTWRARVVAVADALGTTPGRVVTGALALVVSALALAWTLVPAHTGGPPPDDSLPRAARASTTTSVPGAEGQMLVQAAGAVGAPGLYRLPAGARVADLLDAAGGPTPDADTDQLNLAAPLGDGQRVYVPRKGEVPPPSAGLAGSGGAGGGPGPPGPVPVIPLDLNSATTEQLDALPGVGPAIAQAIVGFRQQHGRFRSVDQLLLVQGIGPSKLAALRKRVRV